MKILADVTNKSGVFICEVTRDEIEKFLNEYYGNCVKTVLRPGSEIDLGKGHDFMRETKRMLAETHRFIEVHDKTIKTIIEGVTLFSNLADSEPEEAS